MKLMKKSKYTNAESLVVDAEVARKVGNCGGMYSYVNSSSGKEKL